MATTTLGIFDDAAAARRAIDNLHASPIEPHDISVVAPDEQRDHLSAGTGASVGAVWGGLVGLAALLIPGVGPFIAGGALFAALIGAATGAIVGGIAGALIDAGLDEEEARHFEALVHEGKTLLAVKTRDEDAREVRRILAHAGARSLRDNQTGITGADLPVHIESDANIEDEALSGAVGARRTSAVPAMPPLVAHPISGGTPGIYRIPEAPRAGGERGIYDTSTVIPTDDTFEAGRATTNLAAGSEDTYGASQAPSDGEGGAIITEGWNRTGHYSDRDDSKITPPQPGEADQSDQTT